jgi:membrane-associated phospholipid phosphatase
MKLKYYIDEVLRDISALGSLPAFAVYIVFAYIFMPSVGTKLLIFTISSMVVVYLIRFLYFKERPGKRAHSNRLQKLDSSSFPSLHATRTAGIWVILLNAHNILSMWYIPLAIVILYSRIHLKAHDRNDILAGIALGLLLAITILRFV